MSRYDLINKKIGKAIYEQKVIEKNDKILIGLSGGKDSLIMSEMLAEKKEYFPFPFQLEAIHVNIKNIGYEVDEDYLKHFCNNLNIPLHLENLEVNIENNKSPCFVCSWHRRKTLFQSTQKIECNKLALGHNMDDAAETLLMNMVYHGMISGLPYKVSFFENTFEVIRPLLNCSEKILSEYANDKNYPKEIRTCPHSNKTGRQKIKSIIDQLKGLNKDSLINIFNSVNNQYPEYLP